MSSEENQHQLPQQELNQLFTALKPLILELFTTTTTSQLNIQDIEAYLLEHSSLIPQQKRSTPYTRKIRKIHGTSLYFTLKDLPNYLLLFQFLTQQQLIQLQEPLK